MGLRVGNPVGSLHTDDDLGRAAEHPVLASDADRQALFVHGIDLPPLEVIDELLTGGRSGRLRRRLVDELEIVSELLVFFNPCLLLYKIMSLVLDQPRGLPLWADQARCGQPPLRLARRRQYLMVR